MKNLYTIIVLLAATLSYSQNHNLDGTSNSNKATISNFKISVDVDSAQEIKSTFTVNDFKEILENVEKDQTVFFEIVCNGKGITDDSKTSLRYKVEGNSNDIDGFLKSIKKVRKAAIKYYNNK